MQKSEYFIKLFLIGIIFVFLPLISESRGRLFGYEGNFKPDHNQKRMTPRSLIRSIPNFCYNIMGLNAITEDIERIKAKGRATKHSE